MTQMKENTKQADQQIKAAKILELNLELQDLQAKRKAVAGAFTSRIKEVKQDISDILNDKDTAEEIVTNVVTEHDLQIIK